MLPNYWRQNVKASLVVFLVALPLSLGIALASNAPLASGLLAGIIGGLIVAPLSGSSISVSGPAAGLAVIVATSIQELGSFQIFTMAVFLSGLFQILFACLKGGGVGNYFPTSVIKGMLAAIGILLILKQFPHVLGIDTDFMGDLAFSYGNQNTFSALYTALTNIHPGAVLQALVAFTILILSDRWAQKGNRFFKLIPGALIAVLTSVLLNEVLKNFTPPLVIESSHLVQLPFKGGVNDFISQLSLPDWSQIFNSDVLLIALTLALVGSLESLLSLDAADKLDTEGRTTSKNRELFAQGVGNTLSGLIGGLPVTAVIVRSSANAHAGAKSRLSSFLHGAWLLLCVIAIPHFLNLIPLATLAALLMLVGYKLTKLELIKNMYHKGSHQFIPFMVTIGAILFTDLLKGVAVGMLVGFYYVIRSSVHKSMVLVKDQDHVLIRFHKDVSFLQKRSLKKMFHQVPEGSTVIIDGSHGVYIDSDIEDLIEDYMVRSKAEGINVQLKKSSLSLSPLFKE